MKRPDFILAGATRSGLDTLSRVLDNHPQVYIPSRKEHCFFHQGKILQLALESCKTDFKNAVNGTIGNQIAQDRVLHGEAEFDPARAREGAPMAKVIFTLRDPVERAYAQFLHAQEGKKDKAKNFLQAVEAELSGARSPDTTGKCWIYKNQYQTHIEHWLSFFPKERVLILIYEEWSDPNFYKSHLTALDEFLGLNPSDSIVNYCHEVFAEGDIEPPPKKYPPLNPAIREQLDDILALDKTYIANFLGRDIPSWKIKR